jgi:hypothetical protein
LTTGLYNPLLIRSRSVVQAQHIAPEGETNRSGTHNSVGNRYVRLSPPRLMGESNSILWQSNARLIQARHVAKQKNISQRTLWVDVGIIMGYGFLSFYLPI